MTHYATPEHMEIERLRQQLAEARAKLNEIDLCRMGQAPCAVLLDTYRQLDEARAALRYAEEWATYPPRAQMSREKWLLVHAAALEAARETK